MQRYETRRNAVMTIMIYNLMTVTIKATMLMATVMVAMSVVVAAMMMSTTSNDDDDDAMMVIMMAVMMTTAVVTVTMVARRCERDIKGSQRTLAECR